jgi:phage shock protein C
MNKRLYRSIKDPKVAGVCSGIAEYFNIDPVLIRILFVFLLFFGMLGFFLYIALAIIIPKEPINNEIEDGTVGQETTEQRNTKKDFEEMGKNFGASMEDAGKNFGAKMEDLGKDFEKNMKNFGKEMENHAEHFTKHSQTGKFFLSIVGTLFIGLGATILIAKFFPFFRFGFYFPAILIFCGILLIIFSFNNKPKA